MDITPKILEMCLLLYKAGISSDRSCYKKDYIRKMYVFLELRKRFLVCHEMARLTMWKEKM